jgi:hypothetical protein
MNSDNLMRLEKMMGGKLPEGYRLFLHQQGNKREIKGVRLNCLPLFLAGLLA